MSLDTLRDIVNAALGSVVATGAAFEQIVIAVFRVRDGQILSYRDYINPLPLLDALASITGGTHA
ncbi:nuclear transport factor 2 family protein [Micromonospora sp. NPDC005254]|uniref:nuclear transport factor 2 family protein n=1 Tax=Micromonospora sp. NPDC005254 TaxID=3364229 RepID=UPI0036D1B6F3